MTLDPEQKIEQTSRKLDRWQIATGLAAITAAFLGGLIVQAVCGLIPVGAGAVGYDAKAREMTGDAVKQVSILKDVIAGDERRLQRVEDQVNRLERSIGVPIGQPIGVPQRSK